MKKVDLRKVLVGLAAVSMMCIASGFGLRAQETETGNKLFEIVSVDGDTVKFKTLQATTIYNVSLVSETGESVDAAMISNELGDIKMRSGATARQGSQLLLPKRMGVDEFSLPAGAIIKVLHFKAPADFKAAKIRFETKKDAKPLFCDME